MPNSVGSRSEMPAPNFEPVQQRRAPPPRGVAQVPTTLRSAYQPTNASIEFVETFLIRLKDQLVCLFQWAFCSKPAAKATRQRPRQQFAPHPGPHQEYISLLRRFLHKSDLEQTHILLQIGREIWTKSGAMGYYIYFGQSLETIGRNAIAANPQLLIPFLH